LVFAVATSWPDAAQGFTGGIQLKMLQTSKMPWMEKSKCPYSTRYALTKMRKIRASLAFC
jgi:hypothetical protein